VETPDPEHLVPARDETDHVPEDPLRGAPRGEAEADSQNRFWIGVDPGGVREFAFDRLTQLLAITLDRRGLGGALAASLAALGLIPEAEAGRSRPRTSRWGIGVLFP
jgi:hypothetical protein